MTTSHLILEALSGQRRREDRSPISWHAVAYGAGALVTFAVLAWTFV
jgi:hypothetical protein